MDSRTIRTQWLSANCYCSDRLRALRVVARKIYRKSVRRAVAHDVRGIWNNSDVVCGSRKWYLLRASAKTGVNPIHAQVAAHVGRRDTFRVAKIITNTRRLNELA